jgi:hypothetical protein
MSYVEYAIRVEGNCWIESDYEEVLGIWTFLPALVFKATYKGEDITGEVLSMLRTEYIYG